MTLPQLLFLGFAGLALLLSTLVVTSAHPMRSVLALVGTFLCSAVVWLMLGAEFLSMALVFVYVGAVMALFIFVIMMLNVERLPGVWTRGVMVPLTLLGGGGLVWWVGHSVWQHLVVPVPAGAPSHPVPNTLALGQVLYTETALPFVGVGLVLLVAMVSAIALVFRGRRPGTRGQTPRQQVRATKASRLRVIRTEG